MKWEFLRHIPKKKLILVLGDCLLILLGLAVTRASGPISSGEAVPSLGQVMVVAPTFLFFFYLANLYVPLSPPFQKNKVAARIIMAVAGAALACLMLSLVNPAMNPGRHRITLLSLYMIPAAYLWRWAFERSLIRFLHPVRVLIVGAGWAGSTICSALGFSLVDLVPWNRLLPGFALFQRYSPFFLVRHASRISIIALVAALAGIPVSYFLSRKDR